MRVQGVRTAERQAQAQAPRLPLRLPPPVEEGRRDAAPRGLDRAVRRPGSLMASQEAQAHQPRPPLRHLRGQRRGHQEQAREVAGRGHQEVRRAQRPRPRDLAPPRRRRQAPVPQDRLQAAQGRHPGQGRRDRVRPQPHRLHRAAALRRRRTRPTSWPRRACAWAPTVSSGPDADITPGSALPLSKIPTGTTVHNVELTAGPRRPDGPLRRHRDPAGGQGGRLRHAAPALGRDAHGARRVPRLHRRDRQRRAPEHRARQGRAARATRAGARRRAARP